LNKPTQNVQLAVLKLCFLKAFFGKIVNQFKVGEITCTTEKVKYQIGHFCSFRLVSRPLLQGITGNTLSSDFTFLTQ